MSEYVRNPAASTLRSPVMITAFEGWNDAGDAATSAVEQLALAWDAEPLVDIDPEDYYDFQMHRPTTRLVDGVTRTLEWTTTRLTMCRLPQSKHDLILVHGVEPNNRWRSFCTEILDHAFDLDVSMVVNLGGLLAEVPHTRPIQVSGSSYDEASAERWQLSKSSYEGPTGIVGVFGHACVQRGLPTISFWAAVPQYVSHVPAPKAALALLHRVEDVLDVEVPVGSLPEQAEEWEAEVTAAAAEDTDIVEYIKDLEERETKDEPMQPASGDAIAAEFERYLRRRRPGPGPSARG